MLNSNNNFERAVANYEKHAWQVHEGLWSLDLTIEI